MNRILFAWEMGANLGHLTRLIPLALQLRARGDEVLFAIRDLRHAHLLMQCGLNFVCAPAPRPGIRLSPKFLPVSYADILAIEGMNTLRTIEPQLTAWWTVFDLFKSDVVVLDHAPMAMFAARLAGVLRIAIGTGFELPPLEALFPLFREASPERRHALQQLEKNMLHTLNQLAQRRGCKLLENVSDIFQGTTRCFVTLPEMDHYGQRLEVSYLGLISAWRSPVSTPSLSWPKGKKKILVYLHASYPLTMPLLQALHADGHAAIACVAGSQIEGKSTPDMHISNRFIDMGRLLPHADLLIFHGGHGMTGEALIAGKPMLILPQQLEQSLLAVRIETMAIGKSLLPRSTISDAVTAVNTLLTDATYRVAAEKFREHCILEKRDAAEGRVLSEIDALIGRTP